MEGRSSCAIAPGHAAPIGHTGCASRGGRHQIVAVGECRSRLPEIAARSAAVHAVRRGHGPAGRPPAAAPGGGPATVPVRAEGDVISVCQRQHPTQAHVVAGRRAHHAVGIIQNTRRTSRTITPGDSTDFLNVIPSNITACNGIVTIT